MNCIMNDIKIVSFDLWNTLFDDSSYIQELDEKRIKACDDMLNKYNLSHQDNLKKVFQDERINFQEMEKKGKYLNYKTRIKSILLKVNENVNDKIVEELCLAYKQLSLTYIPTVNQRLITVIMKLRAKSVPCIILSNTGLISAEVTRKLLKCIGLYNLFEHIYLSEEVGICKPNKDFFELPIKKYSIFPHQMLHIGDSDFFDIDAAQEVGCRTIKMYKKKLKR